MCMDHDTTNLTLVAGDQYSSSTIERDLRCKDHRNCDAYLPIWRIDDTVGMYCPRWCRRCRRHAQVGSGTVRKAPALKAALGVAVALLLR